MSIQGKMNLLNSTRPIFYKRYFNIHYTLSLHANNLIFATKYSRLYDIRHNVSDFN